MKWPQPCQNREPNEHQRESPHLKAVRERKLGQFHKAHGFAAGQNKGPQQPEQNHRAADKRVESQFHRPILPPSGAPNGYDEILGDDRDLIKYKQQKEVKTEKNPVNPANQDRSEERRVG